MGIREFFKRKPEVVEQPQNVVRILKDQTLKVLGSDITPSQFVNSSCRLNVADKDGSIRNLPGVESGFFFNIDGKRVTVAEVIAAKNPNTSGLSFVSLSYLP